MSKESEVIVGSGVTITSASSGEANATISIRSAGDLAGNGSGIWKTGGTISGPGSADVNPFHAGPGSPGSAGPWSPGSPGAALPWSVGPMGPAGIPGSPGVTMEDVMDMYKKAGISIAATPAHHRNLGEVANSQVKSIYTLFAYASRELSQRFGFQVNYNIVENDINETERVFLLVAFTSDGELKTLMRINKNLFDAVYEDVISDFIQAMVTSGLRNMTASAFKIDLSKEIDL